MSTPPVSPSNPQRLVALALTLLLSLPISIVAAQHLGAIFSQADAVHYLHLAAGQPAMLPFASRQLAPLLVRALVAALHLSVPAGFRVEAALSLLLFNAFIALVLLRSRAPLWIFPAILCPFFWTRILNGFVLPDLFFAALLSLFLWLLWQHRLTAAALLLFPLMLTRESTLLVLICLLLAGWKTLRRGQIALALASFAAGLSTVHLLTLSALPNREHLAGPLYLLAKLPVNLLRNVFGIEPWADIYPVCSNPIWQTPLHLGTLHAIGVCNISLAYPRHTLAIALASFGLLPLLLLAARRPPNPVPSRPDSTPANSPPNLLLRFCLLYGATSFLLAPLLGFLVLRLFDYAWPLFLVALPLLLANRPDILPSRPAAVAFLALHLALSWAPWWVFFASPLTLLEVDIALYAAAWWLLRRTPAPVHAWF